MMRHEMLRHAMRVTLSIPFCTAAAIRRTPVWIGVVLLSLPCGGARAETEITELGPPPKPDYRQQDYNRVMDCSSNFAYKQEPYRQHMHIVGFKGCISCHRGSQPIYGRGDRPALRYGSFAIQNKFDEDVEFELKIGRNGAWKKYDLAAGKTQVVSWRYERARTRYSPKYFARYAGRKYQLELLATPNRLIGNLYVFQESQLLTSKQVPYRR